MKRPRPGVCPAISACTTTTDLRLALAMFSMRTARMAGLGSKASTRPGVPTSLAAGMARWPVLAPTSSMASPSRK